MELTVKYQFVQDFYGGKGFLPGNIIVKRWLESQVKRLLNPQHKALVDAVDNDKKLEDILNILNVNAKGYPVVGNWMLFRCSLAAQKLAGTWNKFQVSADRWHDMVKFTPEHGILNNGKVIKEPEGVETYAVTTKQSSFFKAYQLIKAGAKGEFTIHFADDLCEKVEGRGQSKVFVPDEEKSRKCVEAVLEKMQICGLGAFRERFGTFKILSMN